MVGEETFLLFLKSFLHRCCLLLLSLFLDILVNLNVGLRWDAEHVINCKLQTGVQWKMCPVNWCFLNPAQVIAGYRATENIASMQIRNQISKNNTRARLHSACCIPHSLHATMQLVFLPVSHSKGAENSSVTQLHINMWLLLFIPVLLLFLLHDSCQKEWVLSLVLLLKRPKLTSIVGQKKVD